MGFTGSSLSMSERAGRSGAGAASSRRH
jgi:hypothetical protein